MSNRGIARGRMFMGGILLFAAVIAWATGLWLNPTNEDSTAGLDAVKETVVIVVRNSAIATLILAALSAWLLFPSRRPKWPLRDWALIAILAVLVGSSLYQLVWLFTVVT